MHAFSRRSQREGPTPVAGYLSPTLTTAVVLYAQTLIMYCFYIQVVKTEYGQFKHVWPPVYCNEVHFWLGVTGGWYVACEWFSCDSAELDNYFGRSATWSATSSRMRMRVDGLASHLELHLLDVTFTVEEVAKSVCKLKGMKTPLVEMVSWL